MVVGIHAQMRGGLGYSSTTPVAQALFRHLDPTQQQVTTVPGSTVCIWTPTHLQSRHLDFVIDTQATDSIEH
jgi:hypothetical protein